MIIVPGINTDSKDTLVAEFGLTLQMGHEVHIDIADGRFVSTRTIFLGDLLGLAAGSVFNLHLMTFLTRESLMGWSESGAKRLFIYPSSLQDISFEEAVKIVESFGVVAGLVIESNVLVEEVKNYLKLVDEVMIMGVKSGPSGQDLLGGVIPKLGQVKAYLPNGRVGIDGGINAEDLDRVKNFDYVVVSTGIFGAGNPVDNYRKLVSVIEKLKQGGQV